MTLDHALQDTLDRFESHLVATGKSAHTIRAYGRDVRLFAEWFDQTNARALSPESITPIDVRQYRSYLLTVKNYKPATVNRKLASLSAFCEWAREAHLLPAPRPRTDRTRTALAEWDVLDTAHVWLDASGHMW